MTTSVVAGWTSHRDEQTGEGHDYLEVIGRTGIFDPERGEWSVRVPLDADLVEDADVDLTSLVVRGLSDAVALVHPKAGVTFTREQVAQALGHPRGSWRRPR